MQLTAKRVARRLLKQPGRHLDGDGLYLQVVSETNASWVLRYERDGRERMMGLGSIKTFTLKEARSRARAKRQLLADGIDPLERKAAERTARALEAAKAITFEQAARQYFDGHEAKWRNTKSRAQFLSTLETYAFPHIGGLSVAAIDTGLVLKVVEPIWQTIPETADRTRRRIENVLDWCTVRGYRSGDNPARWRGHLSEALPDRPQLQQTKHHPALPYTELPTFMTILAAREGVAARALEFTIMTAARTGEVLGATWGEIDLKAKTWTIPPGRIKGGKEHRVPLSDGVLDILESVPRMDGNPFVFITQQNRGLGAMALFSVLRRMGRRDITVHGFRSTFRDWAAERTGFANHVLEQALAHTIGNAVERAYRRSDLFEKRRKLMDAWTIYCLQPVVQGKVIPLKAS
jgi:integrase